MRRQFKAELRVRHGDNCHWCGEPMQFDNPDAPDYATFEHLTPYGEGGGMNRKNIRLAHYGCNHQRGCNGRKH